MRDYLQLIDTDTPGPRNDVTPLFADHEAFSALDGPARDDGWLRARYQCHVVWEAEGALEKMNP